MAIRYNDATGNAMLEGGLKDTFEGGTLTIYDGSAPSNASDSATGTALAAISVPGGGFDAPTAASMSVAGTWTDVADEDGTAGWARLESGSARIDFTSITGSGGGGDLELSNNLSGVADTEILSGAAVNVVSGSLSIPGTT